LGLGDRGMSGLPERHRQESWLERIGRFASGWGLVALSGVIFALFFLIPLGYFFVLSFFTFVQTGEYTTDLTLANYQRLLGDAYYLDILRVTLLLGAQVSLVCFVLGYPLAYFLARSRSGWRQIVLIVVVSSLFTNLIVRTYGWLVILPKRGLLNNVLLDLGLIEDPLKLIFNTTGVIIGLSQIMLPVFVLVVAAVLQAIDRDLVDAAEIAGADPLRAFASIVWPLSLRGVIGGISLVFTLTISSFVTPEFLAGGRFLIAGTLISELMTRTLNYPLAGALAVLLLVTSLVVIAVLAWLSQRVVIDGR
jgi:putative spermidine/putrescine transport system permease protein